MDVASRDSAIATGRDGCPVVTPAHGCGPDRSVARLVVPAPATRSRGLRSGCAGSGGQEPSRRHAAIPGSRLVTLKATGHCPQLSAPEATADAIIDFLAPA